MPERFGEKGYSSLERRWARPTFDVHGIWGGQQISKTAIPARAGANFSFRLVPQQNPQKIIAATRDFPCEADIDAMCVSVREGPPAMRREALDRVRFTFDSIHAEIKDLPVRELIPVPSRPDAPCIDYRHLRTWEWNGRAVFDAMGSQPGEIIPVNVREALEGVRGPLRAELERAEHFKKQHLRERVAIYTDKVEMGSLLKEDRRVQVAHVEGAHEHAALQPIQGDRMIGQHDAPPGDGLVQGEAEQRVATLRWRHPVADASGIEPCLPAGKGDPLARFPGDFQQGVISQIGWFHGALVWRQQ